MQRLEPVRLLTLKRAPAPGLHAFLSAASGLVRAGKFLYVIGDDLHHLGAFRAGSHAPGTLVRLFAGTVSADKKERKKQKPDLEALTRLPAFAEYAHGALLAIGSGSRRNRRMGALLGLDAHGAVRGSPHVVDLSPVLAPLDATEH